jgi:PT repeat
LSTFLSTNQPVNQPTNQPTNQSTIQPTKMDITKDTLRNMDAIKKLAHSIKMQYNALAANCPLGFNICIECPVLLKENNTIIDILVYEFRNTFAYDAMIVYNKDYNIFCFDFT